MTITRTFSIDNLHPSEIAELFANDWAADDQARLFNLIGKAMDDWGVIERDTQFKEIVEGLTPLGREIVVGLGNWL